MRKNISFIVLVLLGLFSISCMKKEMVDPDGSLDFFYATIAEDYQYGEVKSTVNLSDGKSAFEIEDEVAVLSGSKLSYYRYDGGKFVYDRGEKPTSHLYSRAFFPASMVESVSGDNGGTFNITLPDSQVYNTTTLKNLPMMGRSNSTDYVFYNLCTILKLTSVSGDASSGTTLSEVTFISHGAGVAGPARFLENKIEMTEEATKEIRITNIPSSVSSSYYLCLPAQSYPGGYELELKFANGKTFNYGLSRNIALLPGYISAMEAFTCKDFSGGSGSEGNPYRIANLADLRAMRNYITTQSTTDAYRDKHYIQTADIDVTNDDTSSNKGKLWVTGTESNLDGSQHQHFTGSYDGGGHTIKNFILCRGGADGSGRRCALFGTLDGATVKNLNIENAGMQLRRRDNFVSILAARAINGSVIENCTVSGSSALSDSTAVGAIAGELNSSTIRNCKVTGATIEGAGGNGLYGVGGLVGYITGNSSSILNSSFEGTVHAKKNSHPSDSVAHHCGGLVGHCIAASYGNKVENCKFKGTINSQGGAVGGIVANSNASVTVRNCVVEDSEINGNGANVAGITGYMSARPSGKSQGEIYGCVVRNTTITSPSIRTAGILANNSAGRVPVKNCVVEDCTITGNTYVAGAVGLLDNQCVSNITVRNTNINASGLFAGGVVAAAKGNSVSSENSGVEIYDCLCENNIINSTYSRTETGDFECYVGGLVGYVGDDDGGTDEKPTKAVPARIYRCSVLGGSVTGALRKVGGVVGAMGAPGIVNECCASTNVYTEPLPGYEAKAGHVGGIVGAIVPQVQDVLVINCTYYGGEVIDKGTGHGAAGGVVGSAAFLYSVGEISRNYIVNCFANPSYVSTNNFAAGGVAGYLCRMTIDNCYSPTPESKLYSKGASASRGSVVGIMRRGGHINHSFALFQGSNSYDKNTHSSEPGYTAYYDITIKDDAYLRSADMATLMNTGVDAYNNLANNTVSKLAGELPYGIRAKKWAKGTSYDYPTLVGSPICDAEEEKYERVISLPEYKATLYLPAYEGKASPLAIIIPGGGYHYLAHVNGSEGTTWVPFYNDMGYACAILRYTLPGGDCTKPIADVENLIRYLRENATRLHISDIGVHGFSAGGHLASTIATHSKGSLKPNFQVLFYPVITMGSGTHANSKTNFLGDNPSQEMIDLYSNEKQVTADTPKAFVMYQKTETTVPPATNGAAYVTALKNAGVTYTVKAYDGSSHAWTSTAAQADLTTWLKANVWQK